MTWRSTTVKEEREKFIKDVLEYNKGTFTEVCDSYSITPKTGYKWLNRYHLYGVEGLEDQSRAPKNHKNKIKQEVEDIVIQIKRKHRKLGPKKIRAILIRDYNIIKPPSESAIGNILKKNNLTKPKRVCRRVPGTSPLGECEEPNDVWMYDFKGWFLTGDGQKCEPLTMTDGHTRYALVCEHLDRKRSCDVWEILEPVFKEYGLPKRIRSDNGPPFATTGVGRLSPLSIKLIKAGVTPEWIDPGHPEQNGRHERFHLTLKEEVASPPALNLSLQLVKNKNFVEYYNNFRPHEALGQVAPAEVYRISDRKWDGQLKSPEYTEEYEVRRVGKSGSITWKGQAFFLSESMWKEPVGIKQIAWDIMGVYYGPIYLGTIDFSKGFKKLKSL